MKILVSSKRQSIATRCREIRERLDDFAARRLGPTATGEVQGHLLDCQACSEALGELLLEQIDRGALPLLTPPKVPPQALYARYLRGSRVGTLWSAVRDALGAPDVNLREWAETKIQEIRVGFEELVAPPVRLRGAVRTRGAVVARSSSPPPSKVSADVLTAAGESSGTTVVFDVDTPPAINADRVFALELSTDAGEYDGRRVVCTIAFSRTGPVSFEGTVTRIEAQARRVVVFKEDGVPGRACRIPMRLVTLSIA